MAGVTSYFTVEYDNESNGPFVAEGADLTWHDGSGFIVTVIDHGTTGKLRCALLSGNLPSDNDQLTQGSTTADANGDAKTLLYPAYLGEDVSVAASGTISWTGPAVGATHSFFWSNQTVNCQVGDIITFEDGQQCELVTIEADNGSTGEYSVRWITPIDTKGMPDDGDGFTAQPSGGNGKLDGVVHERAYTPLHLHRFLNDLADDEMFAGDDVLAIYKPKPSSRSTDQIITLLGNMAIEDAVAKHMYGGSLSQKGGQVLYSGIAIQVTDADGQSRPIVIQNGAILTDYWKNAFMPNSIIGRIRLMIKTRSDGVDIDGKRVMGRLLEYKNYYFTGQTTLGTAETALALFANADSNNQTDASIVQGYPYNTIVITEGYQLIDYNNGNGATPFALKWDTGSATKKQSYERWKWIQRRGTTQTIFGMNAQLVLGVTRDFAYDNESGGPFSEQEIIAWGTEIGYSNEASGPFQIGEVIVGGTSGARGRINYLHDQGTTGTIIVAQDSAPNFSTGETITGQTSGATATVASVVTNSRYGTGLLIALNDQGTTGNMYYQAITGLDPEDNQKIYGSTSRATALVNGTVASYVNNNQFIGVFTGTDFQTNRGLGLDPSDAQAGDLLLNLLGVQQQPPNNQYGVATGLAVGDRIAMYPWDGTSLDPNGEAEPNFDEMQLATALVQGVSTTVDVGAGNIPNNTPPSGALRIERDSDGEYDLWAYSSHDGSRYFTMVGTAPSNASVGNNVMRAPVDKVATSTTESFMAPYTAPPTPYVIIVRQGGVSPIQPVKATATFGASGFSVGINRVSDA